MDVLVLMVYALAALPAIRALIRHARGEPGRWSRGVGLSAILILLLVLAQSALAIYTDVLWFR